MNLCLNCRHFRDLDRCLCPAFPVEIDVVNGGAVQRYARHERLMSDGHCGVEGRFWEAKAPVAQPDDPGLPRKMPRRSVLRGFWEQLSTALAR